MLAFSGIENNPLANVDTESAAHPNMAAVTEEEGSLVLPDGVSLYTKCWKVCLLLSLYIHIGSF
jgi:acylglycerol lipase